MPTRAPGPTPASQGARPVTPRLTSSGLTDPRIMHHAIPTIPYHTIQYPTMPYQPKDSAPCHTIPCIITPGKAYYTMLCLSQDNLPYLLTMVGTNQRIRHGLQPRKGEIPLLSFGIIPAIDFNTILPISSSRFLLSFARHRHRQNQKQSEESKPTY